MVQRKILVVSLNLYLQVEFIVLQTVYMRETERERTGCYFGLEVIQMHI